jgi:hypothetical protein
MRKVGRLNLKLHFQSTIGWRMGSAKQCRHLKPIDQDVAIMKPIKPLLLLGALLCAAATQSALASPAAASSGQDQATPAQCDSVSFASDSPANRAACRRLFARQVRPTVQTSPLTASDFGS